jgi:hypothetical protein
VLVVVNACVAAAGKAFVARVAGVRRFAPLAAAAVLVSALAGYGAWR